MSTLGRTSQAHSKRDIRPYCGDCGVGINEGHQPGCDVARCLWTGGQMLQCEGGLIAEVCKVLRKHDETSLANELADYHGLDDPDHDCGEDIWTGWWPGELNCYELGWYSYWGPDFGGRGWVRCDADHPGAGADLNRLVSEGVWDREQGKFVARE